MVQVIQEAETVEASEDKILNKDHDWKPQLVDSCAVGLWLWEEREVMELNTEATPLALDLIFSSFPNKTN